MHEANDDSFLKGTKPNQKQKRNPITEWNFIKLVEKEKGTKSLSQNSIRFHLAKNLSNQTQSIIPCFFQGHFSGFTSSQKVR